MHFILSLVIDLFVTEENFSKNELTLSYNTTVRLLLKGLNTLLGVKACSWYSYLTTKYF